MSLSSPETVTFEDQDASVNSFHEHTYGEEPPVFAPMQTLSTDTQQTEESVVADVLVDKKVPAAIASRSMVHSATILLTQRLLIKRIGWTVFVKTQNPIQLDEQEIATPDIAVVRLDGMAYSNRHPKPEDVYLVMEIADAGLEHDLEVKAAKYAAAGIAEYWVLDVIERKLHVLREPMCDDNTEGLGHHYQSQTIVDEWNNIAPLAFTKVSVGVAKMLPPR